MCSECLKVMLNKLLSHGLDEVYLFKELQIILLLATLGKTDKRPLYSCIHNKLTEL